MITEQYVTFDTAKMLKKAGFDIPCNRLFLKDGCPGITAEEENHNDVTCNAYSRPSQQLSARWIREVHGLNISACFNYNTFGKAEKGWFYMRDDTNRNDTDSVYCGLKDYKSYEDAFEAGLQETLRLIIKKNEEHEQRNH